MWLNPPFSAEPFCAQGTRHLRTNTSPVVAADRRASQIHRRGQYQLQWLWLNLHKNWRYIMLIQPGRYLDFKLI
jgi:hypothetical protein